MPPIERWAFSGSRRYGLQRPVEASLGRLLEATHSRGMALEVSVGDAKGLDAIVRRLCSAHAIRFLVHYADWEGLGKRAGHERNTRVLLGARGLLAFYGEDGPTPGTTDAIAQADALGLEVHVFHAHLGRWGR